MNTNRQAERIVWVLSLCTALSLLGDATLYAVLPSQYEAVFISAIQVGWLLSVNRLVRLPLNLGSGWLAGHAGPRALYLLGLALGAGSTIGYGLARGFWPLLGLRALWGLSWALIAVSAYGLVLDYAGETARGRLSGLYTSLSYFGGALGALGGGVLVDKLKLPAAMVILGLASALAVPAALSLPRRAKPDGAARPRTLQSLPLAARLRLWRDALSRLDARLRLVLAVNLVQHFFFEGVFYATFGLYLLRLLGERVTIGALVVGVASLTALLILVRNVLTVLVSPLAGRLSDWLGERRRVLVLGELLGAAGLLLLALAKAPWVAGLGVLLAAAAYGMVPTMLVAWLGDLTLPGERGLLIGAYQTLGDLGCGVGPLAAYALLAWLNLPALYGLSALALLLMVPFIWRIGAARSKPADR